MSDHTALIERLERREWQAMKACKGHDFPMPWISDTTRGPADPNCRMCWQNTALVYLREAATAIAALVEERDEARATVEERGQVIGVPSWQYADLYRRLYAAEADRDALREELGRAKNLLNEWSGSGERELPRLYRESHALLASPDMTTEP